MNIPVEFFLTLSALLFFIGVFGFVTRRNLVAMRGCPPITAFAKICWVS